MYLAVAGAVQAWFKSGPGKRPWLITIGITGLLLISMSPLAWLYSRPLEIWYDENPIPRDMADAIVVLAGAVNSPLPGRPYALAGQDTYVRIQHAAWLFRQWGSRPVLACGGGQDSEAYSETIRRLLEDAGVPPGMIWIEARSRSTHENALYGARILREHGISRIALVIDARSMLRASLSFRKEGISVVPAPLQFYDLDFTLQDVLPTQRAVEANSITAHELGGLAWYWLHGWI